MQESPVVVDTPLRPGPLVPLQRRARADAQALLFVLRVIYQVVRHGSSFLFVVDQHVVAKLHKRWR